MLPVPIAADIHTRASDAPEFPAGRYYGTHLPLTMSGTSTSSTYKHLSNNASTLWSSSSGNGPVTGSFINYRNYTIYGLPYGFGFDPLRGRHERMFNPRDAYVETADYMNYGALNWYVSDGKVYGYSDRGNFAIPKNAGFGRHDRKFPRQIENLD